MTQEDKELLVKDLCARLPYGVKINENIQGDFTVIGLTTERVFTTCEAEGCHNDFPIECVKPYLFPLSSMTDNQKVEYNSLRDLVPTEQQCEVGNLLGDFKFVDNWRSIDYLNSHHIDYRGLIKKGLAIDATGLNIY